MIQNLLTDIKSSAKERNYSRIENNFYFTISIEKVGSKWPCQKYNMAFIIT